MRSSRSLGTSAGLPSHFSITMDHSSGTYSFPHYITPTGLQPDIVWWSDQRKDLWLLELTISYESLVENARRRKREKYHDPVEVGKDAGYRTKLITIEMGLGECSVPMTLMAFEQPSTLH